MFVRMTSLHGWNVCNQMFGNVSLQEQSVMRKGGFAIFKVRVPVNVQSAGVFTVFWIADPFASILSLMVHHYKCVILPFKVTGYCLVKRKIALKLEHCWLVKHICCIFCVHVKISPWMSRCTVTDNCFKRWSAAVLCALMTMVVFCSQGLQGLQQPMYGYEDLQMMQQAARLPLVSKMVAQNDEAAPFTEAVLFRPRSWHRHLHISSPNYTFMFALHKLHRWLCFGYAIATSLIWSCFFMWS